MPNIASLSFFIPELVLCATVLVLLCLSILPHERLKLRNSCGTPVKLLWNSHGTPLKLWNSLPVVGLIISLFFALRQWDVGSPPLFWGLLVLDKPATFFKVIFAVTALLVILFSQKSDELLCHPCEGRDPVNTRGSRPLLTACRGMFRGNDTPEYYALLLASVLGMGLLAQANNLLMIYLSLEFVSLMSYMLVGYTRDSIRSSEAALKYVLYGAVASGVFLYGASLYYGLTGSLDIGGSSTIALSHHRAIAQVSGLFLLAGFLYKIAAVPMHAWCPDAYEGAPTPITAFLSVAPKAAGFAVLMRVASVLGDFLDWPLVIAVISAVTMTVGNLIAIPQVNLKRLLAYSSIAHAGYLLMGVACFSAKGNEAVYFYFIAYLIMNLGAFLVVQIVRDSPSPYPSPSRGEGKGGGDPESIFAYSGLARRGVYGAIIAICMTIFLLSLTGVPPFVGFVGKFYIFSAVIESKLYWLAIVGIINSVISLYYYMRIVKAMCFEGPQQGSPQKASDAFWGDHAHGSLIVLLIFLAILTVTFGLAWQWIAVFVSALTT